MTEKQKKQKQKQLYDLLPEIYRVRDAENNYVLKSLLDIIQEQVDIVQTNISDLNDDFFIETCCDHLIHYIGDLLDVNLVFQLPEENRREVAKTIYYRRRKGTLPILEELARDVTGWGSKAVEFYELLDWNQNLNHVKIDKHRLAEIKYPYKALKINTPFDYAAHTVDIRKPSQNRSWYNIRNIGFFLWRLKVYRLNEVQPRLFEHVGPVLYLDNGIWSPQISRTDKNIKGVYFIEASPDVYYGWAVGDDGIIFHWNGEEWQLQTSGTDKNLRGVHFVDASNGWAVGDDGTILRYQNGNGSWTEQSIGTQALRGVHFIDANKGWAVGDGGFLYGTTNGGANWGKLHEASESLWSVYSIKYEETPGDATTTKIEVWAVGDKGTILHWDGTNWTETSETDNDLRGIYFIDKDNGWVVGDKGTILRYFNGSWTEQTTDITQALRGVHFVDENHGWAVGDKGTVLRYFNGSWTEQTTDITQTLRGVHFVDENHGWVVGSNDPYRYHFNTLGQPIPLFTKPSYKGGTITAEKDLPEPTGLFDFEQFKDLYYGKERGMRIYVEDNFVDNDKVICQDLCKRQDVQSGKLAIDPRFGRFAFAPDFDFSKFEADPTQDMTIRVDYNTAFSADIGAGPYDRRAVSKTDADMYEERTILAREGDVLLSGHESAQFIRVGKDRVNCFLTIQEAINFWDKSSNDAIIQIEDSATYEENITIVLPEQARKLVIQAANKQRPTVILQNLSNLPNQQIRITGDSPDSGIVLNGLFISRDLSSFTSVDDLLLIQIEDNLGSLEINHCTLDPGGGLDSDFGNLRPIIKGLNSQVSNPQLRVNINRSIVGGIDLPDTIENLTITDSIVEVQVQNKTAIAHYSGVQNLIGPPAIIHRSTIIGECYLKELSASEVLFVNKVEVKKKQDGCVRFSYVPKGSLLPRQYKCIYEEPPDELGEKPVPNPSFTSLRFGDPGYCQLSMNTDRTIRTGAEDGSEIGAFQILGNSLRERNLRLKLGEYLPVGLEPGIIYIT